MARGAGCPLSDVRCARAHTPHLVRHLDAVRSDDAGAAEYSSRACIAQIVRHHTKISSRTQLLLSPIHRAGLKFVFTCLQKV
jgi:hypothetical protein